MTEFMKEIKKAGNLTDEEAAQIAASKAEWSTLIGREPFRYCVLIG